MNNKDITSSVVFLTIFLFIISAVTPLAVGYDVKIGNEESTVFGRTVRATISAPTEGLMDHVWSMKCHDVQHTGRSPYSAADNSGVEKWRFRTSFRIEEGIVIDENGTLYVGDTNLYAVYPNGTLKWIFKMESYCKSIPAIAKDGTVCIGDFHGKFYAVNPNGTQKWRFTPSGSGNSITSSPAIGGDGTVYFGLMGPGDNGRVYALNPDKSVKWYYDTGWWTCSSPAIAEDGTIYRVQRSVSLCVESQWYSSLAV